MAWYNGQTIILKEKCKPKDMIIAKISKTIKSLMSKKTQVLPRDAQMNSNPSGKDPPVWDLLSELSSNLDEIQKEVAESPNTKQSKINLEQQLEHV